MSFTAAMCGCLDWFTFARPLKVYVSVGLFVAVGGLGLFSYEYHARTQIAVQSADQQSKSPRHRSSLSQRLHTLLNFGGDAILTVSAYG